MKAYAEWGAWLSHGLQCNVIIYSYFFAFETNSSLHCASFDAFIKQISEKHIDISKTLQNACKALFRWFFLLSNAVGWLQVRGYVNVL